MVIHHLRLLLLKDILQPGIPDVELMELGSLIQILQLSRREIVYYDNLVSFLEKSINDMGAYEPGPPGDQDLHLGGYVVVKVCIIISNCLRYGSFFIPGANRAPSSIYLLFVFLSQKQ